MGRPPKKHSELFVFNDVNYYRHPKSKFCGSRDYFRAQSKKTGLLHLHREVWRFHNGEIPANHVIHHKDGNPLNNALSNLECAKQSQHTASHMAEYCKKHPEIARERVRAMHANRPKIPWNSTPEGKVRAAKITRSGWTRREKRFKPCAHCGNLFGYFNGKAKICSSRCDKAFRRHRIISQ